MKKQNENGRIPEDRLSRANRACVLRLYMAPYNVGVSPVRIIAPVPMGVSQADSTYLCWVECGMLFCFIHEVRYTAPAGTSCSNWFIFDSFFTLIAQIYKKN